jgi:hypothetical protein
MIQKLFWFNNQDFIDKYYIDDVVDHKKLKHYLYWNLQAREKFYVMPLFLDELEGGLQVNC